MRLNASFLADFRSFVLSSAKKAVNRSYEAYFKNNQQVWDDRVSGHTKSKFYDLEGFMEGKNMLRDIELAEIGEVRGKKMLHLQCHFGLDSMSFSRMGAKVTGVDFSAEAIKEACKISKAAGLDTEFLCCNIYDLKNHLKDQYDIVFTSYGVIGWLPDLENWAKLIYDFLKPGGFFYMVEFHPLIWIFNDELTRITYSYFNIETLEVEQQGSYVDKNSETRHKEYSWNHPLSDVLSSLRTAGLDLDFFNEYDYSPYECFPNMVCNPEGNYYIKGLEKKLPLTYSIKATKHKK